MGHKDQLAELAKLAEFYIKSKSYSKTSAEFGVSDDTVTRRLKKIINNKLLPQNKIDKIIRIMESRKRRRITDDDARQVAELYMSLGTIGEVAEVLGISINQAKRRLNAAKSLGSYKPEVNVINGLRNEIKSLNLIIDEKNAEIEQKNVEIEEINNDPEIILNTNRKVIDLKEEVKKLKNSLKVSERDVKILRDRNEILTKIDGRKIKQSNKITPRYSKSEATAVMVASDWHVEEPVDPESMNGFNEYNLEIAEKRARNFFKNGLYLIKKEMQNAKIDNVVLALLGDFISNYIHEELEEEALLSPVMALEFVEDLILEGINFLLDDGSFNNLIIPCCFGNHGRTTKKMRFSTGWQNSYETLMYRHIQKIYADNPRVDVRLTKGYHNLLDIYGHIIRFHHGDAMRGGNGIGGITIPVNRSIGRWNVKESATLDVFGHFHQLQFQSRFVCNGSLIGYNQFAQRFGCEPEAPRQAFFLMDKDHGRTVCAPIFVED